jgi:hypothetical protein
MTTDNWITLGVGLVAGLGIGTGITAWIQHLLKIREVSIVKGQSNSEQRAPLDREWHLA